MEQKPETQPPPPAYQPPQESQQPGYGAQQPGYGGQQPGYGAQQPAYGQQPMMMQPQQPVNSVTIIQQAPPVRPPNYLALAIVTTLCCNFVIGIIAIILSVMSSSAADNGDVEGARVKGKISLGLSLFAIISAILIIVIVIVYVVILANKVVDSVS